MSASANANNKSLSSTQWQLLERSLTQNSGPQIIIDSSTFPWHKTITIKTKESFKAVFNRISSIASSIASYNLPFCIVKAKNITQLRIILEDIYGELPLFLSTLLQAGNDIAICWINGFKPHGDDARPDRGLIPFLRMLIGDSFKVLTFVYGPATQAMIEQLASDPKALMNSNGLWESIILLSDGIICDSLREHTHVVFQQGQMETIRQSDAKLIPMPITAPYPLPRYIGEDDVDTAIHIIFSYLLHGLCFESMCNPPGGDWSGVSLLLDGIEYRWLTLPRVSASGSKRPDHIIQIANNTLISIESKDNISNLEVGIGPRLNQYCMDLFSTPPSCSKKLDSSEWTSEIETFTLPVFKYVSVCAFIKTSDNDLLNVLSKAQTDAAFIFSFNNPTTEMEIVLKEDCNADFCSLVNKIHIPKDLNLKIIRN